MTNPICKTLGSNIKNIRKAKAIKQEQLAEMIGLEIKSLSLIETGKGFVSAKTLEKLAEVLNVTVSELFEEHNNNDAENLYKAIIEHLEFLRNNSEKLKTVLLAIKSLIR